MLVTIFSSLAFTKKRRMMQIFPASLQKFWDTWELRFMVLLSLSLQSILILLGNKRKHCTRIWLRITIWLAYLSADWLATTSLGILSGQEGQGETKGDFVEPEFVIMALWAPFLLLHLGGQDTITAYSMEDNELWLRHFLTFGFQVGVAFYIFLRAWTNTYLNILSIPIFIAGIIKIGERTWALWSASSQQFKESLFPDPDPGPNYARYMEAYSSASYEGFKVDVDSLIESPSVGDQTYVAAEGNIVMSREIDTCGPGILGIADKFLKTFKLLFADLILSFHDVLESRLSLQNGSSKEVFEMMEVELGFMYDLFYTKAAVIYSFMGSFLRLITLSCNISVICAFYVVEKNQYPKVDVVITNVLLLGATMLEIYSIISLLSSDWTMLWLSKHKNKLTSVVIQAISSIQFLKNKRWSGSIGQFNLISLGLKAKKQRCVTLREILSFKNGLKHRKAFKKGGAKCGLARMITGVHESYQKFKHSDIEIVTDDLKKIIFEQFLRKIKKATEEVEDEHKVAEKIKKFCDHRGDKVLESLEYSTQLGWSVEVEFDQSILLWHIATDLCYNSVSAEDMDRTMVPNFREASKLLSEYMLYLLVMRPFMLPNGIGEIRFQDTCAEATEFVRERISIQCQKEACKKLLVVSSEAVLPSQVKGDRSKSVLFDACRLAKSIRGLKNEEEWETQKMWELITEVWIEMLAYAASHCQGIQHARQLRRGGELLTHVWLLMAHLGITDQFQISKGHGRTKLIRK